MKPVNSFFDMDFSSLRTRWNDISFDSGRSLSKEDVRAKIISSGRSIEKLSPEKINLESLNVGFACADSSSALRELRYHALWGVHSVCVYGIFDAAGCADVLAGHGKVNYKDLLFSSDINLGSIVPYAEVDSRANSLRVYHELSALDKCVCELSSQGRQVDYVLLDGSIQTNLKNLTSKSGGFKEDAMALSALKKLMREKNLVGLVEDSHATDLAGELNFEATNMLIFEVALNPMEYVAEERDGIVVCYLKLPRKRLSYLPTGESTPLTVRWEFNRKDFDVALNVIAAVWLAEDDILHPQIYPLRVADYLTRRVRVGGVIDGFVLEKGLERKYRELREG